MSSYPEGLCVCVIYPCKEKKPGFVKRGILQVNKASHAEDCQANPEAAYHTAFSLISEAGAKRGTGSSASISSSTGMLMES